MLPRKPREEGAIRVVLLIHHPPLPGQAPPRSGLEDASEFSRVIEDEGAELILHGHNHLDMLAWRTSQHGSHAAVVGVASGSAARLHRNEPLARYNLLHIGRRDERVSITCTTRGFSDAGGDIVDLAHAKAVASSLKAHRTMIASDLVARIVAALSGARPIGSAG